MANVSSTASNASNAVSRRSFVAGAAGAAGAALVGRVAFASESASSESDSSSGELNTDDLNAWLKDRVNFSASGGATYFVDDGAPTDDDLVEMFKIANSYMYCHLLTAPHFVVLRDPEAQQSVLGSMGITGENNKTVTILVLADGCKDDDHHLTPYTTRHDDMHYWEMYYALVETGQAMAYLNMAARSKGYRVRNYAALDLPNISYENGMGDQETIPLWACGGDWEMIRDENWDIAKYCHSQDGTVDFTHYVYATDTDVPVDGNLTLVCAMAIGKIDEVDAISSATSHAPTDGFFTHAPADPTRIEYNFSFWDTGVDGASLHEFPQAYYDLVESEQEASDSADADSSSK